MPPYVRTPAEQRDNDRFVELARKISQTDVAELLAAGHQDIVARQGVLNDAEQAEYDAILDRLDTAVDADTRAIGEVFSVLDGKRMHALFGKRDTQRGLTRVESAELEGLVDAWQHATLLDTFRRARAEGIDSAASRHRA